MSRLSLGLLLCLAAVGCATQAPVASMPAKPTAAERLEDHWLLEIGNVDHIAALTAVDATHVRLGPDRLVWAGVYELVDDKLVMTQPRYPQPAGFVWQRRGEHKLELMTTQYAGSTMSRPYPGWDQP